LKSGVFEFSVRVLYIVIVGVNAYGLFVFLLGLDNGKNVYYWLLQGFGKQNAEGWHIHYWLDTFI
jgi:hypothetical protein